MAIESLRESDVKMTAKTDTTAYCITFGAQPAATPIKAGKCLYFNFVRVRNDEFTIVQSGLNFYVAATKDFNPPENEDAEAK